MRDEKRAARETQILDAAFAELLERGYRGTTMLAVAKRAGASKETLYSWYGDKRGLFAALVKSNAASIEALLSDALAKEADPRKTLHQLGPLLLDLLLGERAVAINRAAAADVAEGGALGKALAESGRERILPLICQVLLQARTAGFLDFDDVKEAAETYLGLLLGDRPVRRIIGVAAQPSKAEQAARAEAALTRFLRLHAAESSS